MAGNQIESPIPIFERSNQKKSLDQLVDNEITTHLKKSSSPLLILPPFYQMDVLDQICFIGNAEGLSDHPIIHKMIARFLPRAHRITNGKIEHIHWNNVFQIPKGIPEKFQFLPRQLNQTLHESDIHLVILPMPKDRPWWRSLWEINFLWNSSIPVLVVPV